MALTRKRRGICMYVAMGHSSKEIAPKFNNQPSTIETEIKMIKAEKKLQKSTEIGFEFMCEYFGVNPEDVRADLINKWEKGVELVRETGKVVCVLGFIALTISTLFDFDTEALRARQSRTSSRTVRTQGRKNDIV